MIIGYILLSIITFIEILQCNKYRKLYFKELEKRSKLEDMLYSKNRENIENIVEYCTKIGCEDCRYDTPEGFCKLKNPSTWEI